MFHQHIIYLQLVSKSCQRGRDQLSETQKDTQTKEKQINKEPDEQKDRQTE